MSAFSNGNIIEEIEGQLTKLKYYMSIISKQNHTTDNVNAEDFFRDFLNLIHKYELENLNDFEHNTNAIDLCDKNMKICYQVTTSNDRSKIEKTLDGFIEQKLYNDFEVLYILIIGDKKNYRDLPVHTKFAYKVIDINMLLKEIKRLKPKRQKKSLKFLIRRLPLLQPDDSKYKYMELKRGESYDSFLAFYSKEMYEAEDRKFINRFAEDLSELDTRTRKLIYTIMNVVAEVRDDGIYFDYYDVKKATNWSDEKLIKELNLLERESLERRKMIDTPHENLTLEEKICGVSDIIRYKKGLIRLSYTHKESLIELIQGIYKYLLETNSSTEEFEDDAVIDKKALRKECKKIIKELDFRILD
ncbi:SMEK domain-containing protein [Bacillus thuringiensis]|uniref:SMEK domain-containing protein n=1 Tax=Bacillus thuringiensis TaxID=1428 RepID=UPI0024BD39C1|nr:SMEK domain-containing protein [Bacillus thuringiensis]